MVGFLSNSKSIKKTFLLSQYVELLLEISLSVGLVKFVQLALGMCGGSNTLVQVPLSFIEFSFASNEMLFVF